MTNDEDAIQPIWQSQPTLRVAITTDQMRARAVRFEAKTQRRYRMDLVSFALVALIAGVGALMPRTALVRAGGLLLALWAVIGLYSVRRFNSLTPQPSESGASPCLAWYRDQLLRQRDVALSRPLGLALCVPGLALVLMGYVVEGLPWTTSAILGAAAGFVGVGAIIHGKHLAAQFQREIDALQTLTRD
jgi:hypothetical protein